jgi:hypothetical protein
LQEKIPSRSYSSLKRDAIVVALIAIVGILLRLVSMWIASHTTYYPVDEYYVDQQAASALARHLNPYSLIYFSRTGIAIPVFAYFPMIALYYLPFAQLGDIRYGNILADVVIIVSLYFLMGPLKKSLGSKRLLAPLAYSLFPTSIWLTSVAGTNMMVGAMFLVVTLALIANDRFLEGSIVYGLALSTNQLAFFAFPVLFYYYWRRSCARLFLISPAVAALVALPFAIADPAKFYYDVLLFQFARPLQPDGWLSLYSFVYSTTGAVLGTGLRLALFLSSAFALFIFVRKNMMRVVLLSAGLILLGVLILPVNGFWNYLVVPGSLFCVLVPNLASRLELVEAIKFPTVFRQASFSASKGAYGGLYRKSPFGNSLPVEGLVSTRRLM